MPGSSASAALRAAAASCNRPTAANAAAALKAAEALDPGVKERPDYQEVVKKIRKS